MLGEPSAGLLLHLTSLPGPHGVGELGSEARRFASFAAQSGARWWHTLPVGPVDLTGSPYGSPSAFAGNPLLVGFEPLEAEGLLSASPGPRGVPPDRVDYGAASRYKFRRLRSAFEQFMRRKGAKKELEAFLERHADWAPDHALFEALKHERGGRSWVEWEPELARRDAAALAKAARRLERRRLFHAWVQLEFERQWAALKAYCGELGLGLIGDIPIFVSHDSADVWSHQELFFLDERGRPTVVAGVPPDYFSETGQRWGNPLYRWDAHRERGYGWWLKRLATAFERFDAVRLDHFIGFSRYWEIPASEPTAIHGRWVPAPGADFFGKVVERFGKGRIIAEDLGTLTDEVVALRDRFEFPGMVVLQFAFSDPHKPFRPDAVPKNRVLYTGTHDNDTVVGWSRGLGRPPEQASKELEAAGALLPPSSEFHWGMIELALSTAAATAVVPVQDLLGLGSDARLNRPGTSEGNWAWRLKPGELGPATAERFRRLVEKFGRSVSPRKAAASV